MPFSLSASMLSTLLFISISRSLAPASFGPSAHRCHVWMLALHVTTC